MDKEIDLILEFESECMEIAQPIINRLCKRAMHTMNKKTANYFDCEDYPATFSFIDILSIKIQEYSFDEINPYLEDYIDSTLQIEFAKLPRLERLAIAYCDCSKDMQSKYNGSQPNIYNAFRKLLDEHYYLKKIQTYVDKSY